MSLNRWILLLGLLCGAAFYMTVQQTSKIKNDATNPQLYIALPPALQMVLAGGDRYLAANIAVSRAVVVSVDRLDRASAGILAQIQRDAAILNPYHEDNYYLSAAILSWIDQYDAAQFVLKRASDARTNDALPPFFLGFNYQYFRQDYAAAAQAIKLAADRSTGKNQLGLTALAARWAARQSNLDDAIRTVSAMRDHAKDPALRDHLDDRVTKLKGLVWVRQHWFACSQANPEQKPTLANLIRCVEKSALPDGLMLGWYAFDAHGQINIAQ